MSAYEDLKARADARWQELTAGEIPWIRIGTELNGQAAGALEVLDALRSELDKRGVEAEVDEVGTLGLSYAEPLVDVLKPGSSRLLFSRVTPEDVPDRHRRVHRRRPRAGTPRVRLPWRRSHRRRAGPELHAAVLAAATHRHAQRGAHRSRRHPAVHRQRRVRCPQQGPVRNGAERRDRRDEDIQPARARRRGIPCRAEVELHGQLARPGEVHRLQLRGGRPRRVQRQGDTGKRPPIPCSKG